MLCFGLVACATTDEPTDPAENPDENQVTTPENPVIRLSTTTSVNDSELLPYLQKEFEADTGYTLEITLLVPALLSKKAVLAMPMCCSFMIRLLKKLSLKKVMA